ncbi:MAG TPA: peroxiredoxin [Streptosporangiaceae bacterium]|jgi:peroxiredoxin Q/BCP
MAKRPEIGAVAPDFTLPGLTLTDGEAERGEYTLSSARGRPLVLAFYPADNSPVCTRQMCSYTNDLESFTKLDAAVWAISPQDLDSHEGFARKHSLGFPLLSDTDGTVTKLYGIGLGSSSLRRSVFVLDAGGVVRWEHVTMVGLTFPKPPVITAQLAALAS